MKRHPRVHCPLCSTVKAIGIVVGVLGGLVALGSLLPGPDIRAEAIRNHPSLAAVMTGDYDRNYCIVGAANRLRATRGDYAQMAVMVCNAAANVVQ
jgi:hypothetical protein